MFLQRRIINGKTYTYLEHSFRLGERVQKASFILSKESEEYNERIIEKIARARATYFKDAQTYFTEQELNEIEKEKIFYQIFFPALDPKAQEEILAEFIRLFLANSMELEGSTITPQLAESIERQKKVDLPESEVKLYQNSMRVLIRTLSKGSKDLRSVIQFQRLHQEIYEGIYPHAGEFKKQPNTFGYIEKAITVPPEKVREELKRSLEHYKSRSQESRTKDEGGIKYPFLRPLLFHLNYQKIHPFADGNSRLGRMVLVAQMFKLNYPPLIFKGDQSFQIRETLVEYCNNGHWDFCRLAMEQYLQTAKKFWRPMIRKFLF